jgi:hypothetical protein
MPGAPAERYPWWVRLTLMAGGRTRRGQWIYVGLSLLSAAVCAVLFVALELRTTTAVLLGVGAVAFVISAAWYLLSIRWIDTNGTWQ